MKHPLLGNPKGHCNGIFETHVNVTSFRLLNSYRSFEGSSEFYRVNIPKSVDFGPLDPEVEGDTFLQNGSNDLPLDTALHSRLR
jgi:hypothetical protein